MADDAEKLFAFPAIARIIDAEMQVFLRELRASLEDQFHGDRHFESDLFVAGDVNAAGDIIAAGMVRQGNTWHAFGGFQDESETIDLSSGNYEHITNVTNDLWTGIEADGITLAGDIITIINTGDYQGVVSLSFSGGNTKDYFIRIYNITQEAVMGYHIGRTGSGNTNFGNACIPIYIEANAGDTLKMEIQSSDGTDAIMRSAIFWMSYIHD